MCIFHIGCPSLHEASVLWESTGQQNPCCYTCCKERANRKFRFNSSSKKPFRAIHLSRVHSFKNAGIIGPNRSNSQVRGHATSSSEVGRARRRWILLRRFFYRGSLRRWLVGRDDGFLETMDLEMSGNEKYGVQEISVP